MKLGTVYDITFSTNRADTGALSSADSTPVVRVTENGVNLAYLPTVSTLSTGVYLVSIDTSGANGFEVGKRYSVYCTATVNAIDGATGLDSFTIETRSIDDVLPTSGYTAPDNATISAIQTEVNSHPTLAEIEASTILAKEATIPTVGEIRTELSPELLLITTNLDAKVSEAGGTGGGLTTEEHDKLFSLENSTGGGGFSINYGAINSHTTKKVNEAIEEIVKSKTDLSGIENTLNDIDSHITLAFDSTIDTIKETENYICKDIKKTKSELEKDNVATRQLVRQKTKNLAELAQKQLDSDAKEDKMMKDIQKEFEELENEDNELEKEFENQEMEDIKKEFENQEKETKQP